MTPPGHQALGDAELASLSASGAQACRGRASEVTWSVLVSLVLGITITIVVAWGCVLHRVFIQRPGIIPVATAPVQGAAWPFDTGLGWAPPNEIEVVDGPGYRREYAAGLQSKAGRDGAWKQVDAWERMRANRRAATSLAGPSGRVFAVYRRQVGWPMFSMESRFATEMPTGGFVEIYIVGEEASAAGAARMSISQMIDRGLLWPARYAPLMTAPFTLPLRPVWHGFAVGVLFWSGLSWLALQTTRALRGRSRVGAGQCRRCGYQRGDLPICPECGMPRRDPSPRLGHSDEKEQGTAPLPSPHDPRIPGNGDKRT